MHAGLLPRCELLVANTGENVSDVQSAKESVDLLIGIIHVVVDGVITRLVRAGVSPSRATTCLLSLSRGVADEISTSAAILEGVEKVEPVTNLVNGSSTQVVGLGTATRDSLGNNDATVLDKGRGSGRDVGLGEVAVSKSLKAVELSNVCEVQVESAVISLAKLSLHGNLSITSSPVGVGREGGVNQVEGNAVRAVGIVKSLELILELLLGDVL